MEPPRAQGAAQLGSGEGPYADVVDYRWRGTISCPLPLAGLAFLVTPETTYWVRSAPPVVDPAVEVSLHAWAEHHQGRATFTARFHGAYLPGVPYACGHDPKSACNLGQTSSAAGQAWRLAAVPGAEFFLLLVPRSIVKVGRNRLWRFRQEFAVTLPADLHDFAHGRSGTHS